VLPAVVVSQQQPVHHLVKVHHLQHNITHHTLIHLSSALDLRAMPILQQFTTHKHVHAAITVRWVGQQPCTLAGHKSQYAVHIT
jgi:hypothetical protein